MLFSLKTLSISISVENRKTKSLRENMPSCTFCKGNHRINHCDSPQAQDWLQYAHDAVGFSMMSYEDMTFARYALGSRFRQELQVIGYQLGFLRLSMYSHSAILDDIIDRLSQYYPTLQHAQLVVRRIQSNRFQCFISYMDRLDDARTAYARPMMIALYGPKRFKIKAYILADEEDGHTECSICMNEEVPNSDMAKLNCDHSFCAYCYRNYLAHVQGQHGEKIPKCALCRTKTTHAVMSHNTYNELDLFLDEFPVLDYVQANIEPHEEFINITAVVLEPWEFEQLPEEIILANTGNWLTRAFGYVRSMF